MDTFEHRAVINYQVQAGTSPMQTKRFLNITGDGPHMSNFFLKQRLTNRIKGFKYERTDILSTLTA